MAPRVSMLNLVRAMAIAASAALHLAALLAIRSVAEPAGTGPDSAFERDGTVEIGLVYSEPPRSAPNPSPGSPAPAPLVAPLRSPRPAIATEPAVGIAPTQPAAPVSTETEGTSPVPASAEVGSGSGVLGGPSGTGPGDGQGAGPGVVAEGSGGGGTGPDVAEEIARRLASAAARSYPRAAARLRAEGVAKVRFCVGEAGEPREVRVVESSGFDLLDEAALVVVARAAPFPRTRECLAVPVRFKLGR